MAKNVIHIDRVRLMGCAQCGKPYTDGDRTPMTKFLGWELGSCVTHSGRQLHVTLIKEGARVTFSLNPSGTGFDAKLLRAEIPLSVDQRTLSKLSCSRCAESERLQECV